MKINTSYNYKGKQKIIKIIIQVNHMYSLNVLIDHLGASLYANREPYITEYKNNSLGVIAAKNAIPIL